MKPFNLCSLYFSFLIFVQQLHSTLDAIFINQQNANVASIVVGDGNLSRSMEPSFRDRSRYLVSAGRKIFMSKLLRIKNKLFLKTTKDDGSS